jgi:K+-transporting ATPase ATPase C chain
MFKTITSAIALLIVMTLVTGVIYPLIVTGIALVAFPTQARGSLVVIDGKTVGSSLIGQQFDDPKYFWGRLSATSPMPYNASASSGSNLGPTNPALINQTKSRVESIRMANPAQTAALPVDLVTSSGSGLDPEISPAAAAYQAGRVARARGMDQSVVMKLIEQHVTGRQLGVLGEPRVNVLLLNLALDGLRR